jgi:PRTRC genetic system protein C
MSTQTSGLFDDEDEATLPLASSADDPAVEVSDTPNASASAAQEAPLATYIRREFHYATHVIADPSLDLSVEDVRKALIPYFPDLVQATYTQRVQDDTLVVTFSKQVTRKGAEIPSAPDTSVAALGHAIRTLPRFRDPITSLCLPPETTLADLAARRTDIRDLLDAYRTLPDTLQRMATRCRTLPPTPLTRLIPHGF